MEVSGRAANHFGVYNRLAICPAVTTSASCSETFLAAVEVTAGTAELELSPDFTEPGTGDAEDNSSASRNCCDSCDSTLSASPQSEGKSSVGAVVLALAPVLVVSRPLLPLGRALVLVGDTTGCEAHLWRSASCSSMARVYPKTAWNAAQACGANRFCRISSNSCQPSSHERRTTRCLIP
jgi:hypothetical protein